MRSSAIDEEPAAGASSAASNSPGRQSGNRNTRTCGRVVNQQHNRRRRQALCFELMNNSANLGRKNDDRRDGKSPRRTPVRHRTRDALEFFLKFQEMGRAFQASQKRSRTGPHRLTVNSPNTLGCRESRLAAFFHH
jgi:hypothetical protein